MDDATARLLTGDILLLTEVEEDGGGEAGEDGVGTTEGTAGQRVPRMEVGRTRRACVCPSTERTSNKPNDNG